MRSVKVKVEAESGGDVARAGEADSDGLKEEIIEIAVEKPGSSAGISPCNNITLLCGTICFIARVGVMTPASPIRSCCLDSHFL